MSKNESSDKHIVLDPPRCSVCGTKVTLYPLGWKQCPHCDRPVCRQCWGSAWGSKSFDADKCVHADGSSGPTVVPIGEKMHAPGWAWPSGLVSFALFGLIVLILYLLWDLLAF